MQSRHPSSLQPPPSVPVDPKSQAYSDWFWKYGPGAQPGHPAAKDMYNGARSLKTEAHTHNKPPQSPSDASSDGMCAVKFEHQGRVHSLLLTPELGAEEAQHILQAVFGLQEAVVGLFEPTRQIIFPFSLVAVCPSAFADTYRLVLQHSGVQQPSVASGVAQATPQRSYEPLQRPSANNNSIAQNAFNKARELARIAAASASPIVSSSNYASDSYDDLAEEEEKESEIDETYAGEISEDGERSDQREDPDAADAAFDRAVQRAMANGSGFAKGTQSAANARQRYPLGQQAQQRPLPSSQSRAQVEQERALQERLVQELGGYDSRGEDGGVDGDAADQLRQEFWQREREKRWIEAEQKVLQEEAAKLAQQRVQIEQLRSQQARLQAEQAQALALVQQRSAQQDAAARSAAAAAKKQVHAATALKSAVNGRAARDYATFEQSDSEANSDEQEQSEEEEEVEQLPSPYDYDDEELDSQEDDEEEEENDEQEESNSTTVDPASRFMLNSKEQLELEDLQMKTGFASISLVQLMHLFARRVDRRSNRLSRSDFDVAASEFVQCARVEEPAAQQKAVLVLRRIFDLFCSPDAAGTNFGQFATGLTLFGKGEREQKIYMALSEFNPSKSAGYASLEHVTSYFYAFFTVLFDLSVALQTHILPAASCADLAKATAHKCWSEMQLAPHQWISLVQFAQWSEEEAEQQQQRQVQEEEEEEVGEEESFDDQSESEDDEGGYGQERTAQQQKEDDEEDERFVAEAAHWLQQQRQQQAQRQQAINGTAKQQQNGRAMR